LGGTLIGVPLNASLGEEKSMANMSYCRFTNTLGDLKDCYDHMADDDNAATALSAWEKKSRDQLIKLCHRIASDFPIE